MRVGLISDALQVSQASIPTGKQRTLAQSSVFPGFLKHRLEMDVFAFTVLSFSIDSKVVGDESFSIGLKNGLKIYAAHHLLVLTAPMLGDYVEAVEEAWEITA